MHQSGTSRPGMTRRTKKNDFSETIATDWYKTSDTVTDGTIMTRTRTREAVTIMTIVIIEITPPAIIGEERINGNTMKTGAGKDTGTTDAIIKNETLEKRIVGKRQWITNESQIEA